MKMAALRLFSVFLLVFGGGLQAAVGDKTTETVMPVNTSPVGPNEVVHVFLALLFILGVIVLVAWLMRRYVTLPSGRSGALRMLAAISVGQRERVVLVQAGETQLLIGIAPGQVRTLHVFDKPVVLANGGQPVTGERFAERLAAAINRPRKEAAK